VSRVEASLASEVAVQRAEWQALEEGVREAKRAAGEAHTVASRSAALSDQASQAAKNAMSILGRLNSPGDSGSTGSSNNSSNAAATMTAVAELESRLVHGMIEPLSDRMRKSIQEVAQVRKNIRRIYLTSKSPIFYNVHVICTPCCVRVVRLPFSSDGRG